MVKEMISVEELNREATCDIIDENGSFTEAIPVFKTRFAKKTKDMWNMFSNGDKFTNKELAANIDDMVLLLNKLKNDISQYSIHNGDLDDWI